jgi:hypothetical protein
MNSLETYREQVRLAIARRDGKPLLNGSSDHAAIIIQEAFRSAKQTVRVLTSKLSPECYAVPEVCTSAKNFFLDNDHRAQILIEAPKEKIDWKNHPFITELYQFMVEPDRRLEIRLVPKSVSETYPYNFLLLDNYGYRYESDRNGRAAVAAFLPEDNTAAANHLGTIFSKIWESSSPLPTELLEHR